MQNGKAVAHDASQNAKTLAKVEWPHVFEVYFASHLRVVYNPSNKQENGWCGFELETGLSRCWGKLVRIGRIYWPLVIACLWGLAWLLTGAPGERVLLPLDPVSVTVYLAVLSGGMVVAAASRILITGGPEMDRQAVVWVAVMICAVLGYHSQDRISNAYDRMRPHIYPSVALTTAQGEKTLHRHWDGHYRVLVTINDGIATEMLVDTGASMVLIPFDRAQHMGIDRKRLKFTLPVTTANGRSWVAPVTLASVRIGDDFVVVDVEAAVAMPDTLKTGLLGMSFLERLEETTFRKGQLILRY